MKAKKMRAIKFRAWNRDTKCMYPNMNYLKEGEIGASSLIFMQWSGLLDRARKEIFEGDIIQNRDGIWEVTYENSLACFYMTAGNELQKLNMCCRSNEVIGNIFETPELMKPIEVKG